MNSRWLRRFFHGQGRATKKPVAQPISAVEGQQTALFQHLRQSELVRHATLMNEFLSRFRVVGAGAYRPSNLEVRWVAAQACLPVLNLDLDAYGPFVDVIIYPSAFIARHEKVDGLGLYSETEEVLSGEAMDHGPVALNALDLPFPPRGQSNSLVVHEFTHKLDATLGLSVEPERHGQSSADRLARALAWVYRDVVRRTEQIEASLPGDLDPESDEAETWFSGLPIDPYATTSPAECLAVCVEAFFCGSPQLAAAYPDLVEAMAAFFGQRPLIMS